MPQSDWKIDRARNVNQHRTFCRLSSDRFNSTKLNYPLPPPVDGG